MAGRRTGMLSLVLIIGVAVSMVVVTLVKDWSPELGLDLQGGISAVLQPTNDVPDQALDDTMEIIRNRIDSLGVAEPEIVRQGNAIIVNLPGVTDRERALEVIGRTAELQFRPVLQTQQYITAAPVEAGTSTTTTVAGATTTTTAVADPAAASTTTVLEGSETTTTEGAAAPLGLAEGEFAAALPTQDASTTTTLAADPSTATTTTTVPAVGEPTDAQVLDGCALLGGITPPDQDLPEATVVLPGKDDAAAEDEDDEPEACYELGPVPTDGERTLTGRIVSNPQAQINNGEWGVSLEIKGDDLPLFNEIASQCYNREATCPTGQLAIVLDSVVQSAPSINEPSFTGQGLQISGSFTQGDAKDLALVLRSGALPVELEVQTVQTVSATLGEDSLRAGLLAGFIGIALVAIYMLLYYRALGVVVLLGLAVWSAINFSIVAWLGHTQGLALSLAGVTGIVVSIGVTVDSYVVYFERLKDEIRSGKTIRSSVDRGFHRAFRTILAADISSFIGAALLYTLTVGPVRGFAFFLGLSTILDVVVSYFFTRPFVNYLGRSNFFTDHHIFGVARGLGVRGQDTMTAGID